MRALPLLTLLAPIAFAADPATLHVNLKDGQYLSFKLENHYSEPVTHFEVAVDFQQKLGCSIAVDVRRPQDLQPNGTCSLPIDQSSGKVDESMSRDWKARIVVVEYANGMRWTPKN